MKKPPIRLWIGVMIFFTTFTSYMLRSNISVSIIRMVERRSKNFTPACLENTPKDTTTKDTTDTEERFNWNENEVGWILGAYFWGYIITGIPGGILAEMFGPWHVIFWSNLLAMILTGLTPVSATSGGVIGMCANRFLIGLLGGVTYPAVNVLIAKWAPPKEKGRFVAAMMGNTLGTVITFNAVGWTTEQWGWAWGFYSLVIAMGVYCTAVALIVRDSPEKHPWISEEEKKYIKEAQGEDVSAKKKVPPYVKILKSRPFWIMTIAQFGNLWGLNLMLSYAPKYLAETLGFDLKASAGLAALPYLGRLIFSSIFGTISDYMLIKEVMSKTNNRKFFAIFSHLIPATCMFLMYPSGCNHVIVVTLLILNQSFNGALVASHLVLPQDLAPNFAGSLFGMMNLFGMTTGLVVPPLTGYINYTYNMSLKAAAVIFSVGACVLTFTGIVFILFQQATVQPWNAITEEE